MQLHFSDPAVYNEIYNARSRWSKDRALYQPFEGEEASTLTTTEYREAKKRRDMTTSHFARKSILSLQGVIQERVCLCTLCTAVIHTDMCCLSQIDELCEIIASRSAEDKPTDIFRAFRCLDFDSVTSYCFGWSLHVMKAPDFKAPVVEEARDGESAYLLMKYFPVVRVLFISVLRVMLLFMNKKELKGQLQVHMVRGEHWYLPHYAPHSPPVCAENQGTNQHIHRKAGSSRERSTSARVPHAPGPGSGREAQQGVAARRGWPVHRRRNRHDEQCVRARDALRPCKPGDLPQA